jgi:hypothetical protein
MYNIHSHYENILSYAKSIIAQPTVAYLHPFGSTQPENLETLNSGGFGPVLFCYDQEPLLENFNDKLFYQSWRIVDDHGNAKQAILLNTERTSTIKNKILQKFGFIDCNYFFHAFAAADWYRGYRYSTDIVPLNTRKIKKKFITFNRLTGGARSYRSILVAELIKNNLINKGHVSYSFDCPQHGSFEKNLYSSIDQFGLSYEYVSECVSALNSHSRPLTIDTGETIHNDSQTLGALPYMIESFLHVVTETCFWEDKTHLTEKIFKPIVAKQPFVLLGCANNLAYLQSYGFKTFDKFWDESYDSIADPVARLQAVIKIIDDICNMSNKELHNLLLEMADIVEHNYNWFYSQTFIDSCWQELTDNLKSAIARLPPRICLETLSRPYLYTGHQNTNEQLLLDR